MCANLCVCSTILVAWVVGFNDTRNDFLVATVGGVLWIAVGEIQINEDLIVKRYSPSCTAVVARMKHGDSRLTRASLALGCRAEIRVSHTSIEPLWTLHPMDEIDSK